MTSQSAESHTEKVRLLLILGLVLLAVGLSVFGAMFEGALSPVLSPGSPPFLIGFMTSLGGVSLCAFYLALKVWNWLYKRSS